MTTWRVMDDGNRERCCAGMQAFESEMPRPLDRLTYCL
jgi:hypothetical protein